MPFPDSNLSGFWLIFFKLCMDIDIGEEWFGIANGLNSFINNRVMAVHWCKNVFLLNNFRTNGWILIKFCICIDKYKIHVVCNARYFWSILTELWPLIDVRILFMLNILWINLWILYMHWYWQDVHLDDWTIFFIHFQQLWPLIDVEISFMLNILWTNWWILIKFCKCIDIDKM